MKILRNHEVNENLNGLKSVQVVEVFVKTSYSPIPFHLYRITSIIFVLIVNSAFGVSLMVRFLRLPCFCLI